MDRDAGAIMDRDAGAKATAHIKNKQHLHTQQQHTSTTHEATAYTTAAPTTTAPEATASRQYRPELKHTAWHKNRSNITHLTVQTEAISLIRLGIRIVGRNYQGLTFGSSKCNCH